MKLITIAKFSHPLDAHLAKTKLESEEIECFIADENIVQMNWLLSNAVGGVRLQVKENDAEAAKKILKELNVNEIQQDVEDKTALTCPKCNSTDVYYEKFARRNVFLSWLVTGIPLLFMSRTWCCNKCHYQWKMKK